MVLKYECLPVYTTSRMGKGDDLMSILGKSTYNNGKLLINLLHHCNLMVCNRRTLSSEPRCSQVQDVLIQTSTVDYKATDNALMSLLSSISGNKTV